MPTTSKKPSSTSTADQYTALYNHLLKGDLIQQLQQTIDQRVHEKFEKNAESEQIKKLAEQVSWLKSEQAKIELESAKKLKTMQWIAAILGTAFATLGIVKFVWPYLVKASA
jgi:hypothetical protein